MQSLLQEIYDFKKYKICLKELYEDYRNYLVEKVLNEITADRLALIFDTITFNRKEIDSLNATVNAAKRHSAVMQNYTYERKQMGKKKIVVPNELTHLEKSPGAYCDKETFQKEFAKIKFEAKEDMSKETIDYLANLLLDEYLKNFDDEGWLILKRDDYELVKTSETLDPDC